MPIATISPQNNSQQAVLAQSLSGTGSSLLSALNSAIQKSRDDAQVRFNQEQNLINEQQRNIQNDRIERFNVQDRTEFALNFAERKANNDLDRSKKRLDLGQLEKDNSFTNSERNKAVENDVTDVSLRVEDKNQRNRAIAEGVDPISQAKSREEQRTIENERRANLDSENLKIKQSAENRRVQQFESDEEARQFKKDNFNEFNTRVEQIINKDNNGEELTTGEFAVLSQSENPRALEILGDRTQSTQNVKAEQALREEAESEQQRILKEFPSYEPEQAKLIRKNFKNKFGFDVADETFDDRVKLNAGSAPVEEEAGSAPVEEEVGSDSKFNFTESSSVAANGNEESALEIQPDVQGGSTSISSYLSNKTSEGSPLSDEQKESFRQTVIKPITDRNLDDLNKIANGSVTTGVSGSGRISSTGGVGNIKTRRTSQKEKIKQLREVAEKEAVNQGIVPSIKNLNRLRKLKSKSKRDREILKSVDNITKLLESEMNRIANSNNEANLKTQKVKQSTLQNRLNLFQ